MGRGRGFAAINRTKPPFQRISGDDEKENSDNIHLDIIIHPESLDPWSKGLEFEISQGSTTMGELVDLQRTALGEIIYVIWPLTTPGWGCSPKLGPIMGRRLGEGENSVEREGGRERGSRRRKRWRRGNVMRIVALQRRRRRGLMGCEREKVDFGDEVGWGLRGLMG